MKSAAQLGWAHADLLDGMTWAELNHVWLGGSGVRVSAEQGNGTLRDQINRKRAAMGLSKMKPAPVPQRR